MSSRPWIPACALLLLAVGAGAADLPELYATATSTRDGADAALDQAASGRAELRAAVTAAIAALDDALARRVPLSEAMRRLDDDVKRGRGDVPRAQAALTELVLMRDRAAAGRIAQRDARLAPMLACMAAHARSVSGGPLDGSLERLHESASLFPDGRVRHGTLPPVAVVPGAFGGLEVKPVDVAGPAQPAGDLEQSCAVLAGLHDALAALDAADRRAAAIRARDDIPPPPEELDHRIDRLEASLAEHEATLAHAEQLSAAAQAALADADAAVRRVHAAFAPWTSFTQAHPSGICEREEMDALRAANPQYGISEQREGEQVRYMLATVGTRPIAELQEFEETQRRASAAAQASINTWAGLLAGFTGLRDRTAAELQAAKSERGLLADRLERLVGDLRRAADAAASEVEQLAGLRRAVDVLRDRSAELARKVAP